MSSRNFIPLKDIVNNMLLTRDEDDYGKYMNAWQLMTFGKECIRNELAVDLAGYVKSVKLTVNETLNTAELPIDYLDYTKIGVLDKKNEVRVLYVNDKINIAGSILFDAGGAPILDSDGRNTTGDKEMDAQCVNQNNSLNNYYLFHNYWNGEDNGAVYGLGGGKNQFGYYRINDMDNRIDLDTCFDYSEGIILEYIGDESMAQNPMIPFEAEAMVRDYIYFRMIAYKRNVPQSAVQVAERRFRQSKRRANFKRKMFTKAEALQQINRRYQQTPKFAFE